MSGDPVRRGLGWRLPFSPRDAVFLACLALSLTIAAVAFSGYQAHEAYTDYCKASAHTGEQGCKAEKPFGESVFADPVVFFACITALFTGCLIVVGVAQAGLFWWQLHLIRDGLSDTEKAADAAREQARLARETLIASQRAWLKVEAYTVGEEATFDERGFRYLIGIRVKNVGNSPATGVYIETMTFSGVGARVGPDFNVPCETTRSTLKNIAGISLFPGEEFPAGEDHHWHAWCSKSVVDACSVEIAGSRRALLQIGGCVTYRFATDASAKHQTRFIYEPKYGGLPLPVIEIPLDPEYLTLSRSVLSAGNYAD